MATMDMTATTNKTHRVVAPAEWRAARKELLRKEKEFSRLRDELSAQRRALPWEKVEKNYVFDGAKGKQTLADLFGPHHQLIVYHFMFAPGWKEGCPSCSFIADGFDNVIIHLAHRDTKLMAVSRATFPEISAFKKRMGWQFEWVSSNANDFNRDYHVSFSKEQSPDGKIDYNYQTIDFAIEELPGASVFYKNDAGEIFHTYSTYARGLDPLLGTYQWLDFTPKGRDENGLKHSMAWVRHHDKYDDNYSVDATQGYVPPEKAESSCCGEKKAG